MPFQRYELPQVGDLCRCFPLHFLSHWGIHACYALIALAVCVSPEKEKYLLSVTLKPLVGKNNGISFGKIRYDYSGRYCYRGGN